MSERVTVSGYSIIALDAENEQTVQVDNDGHFYEDVCQGEVNDNDNETQGEIIRQEQLILEEVINSKGLTRPKIVRFTFAILLYYADIASDCWLAYDSFQTIPDDKKYLSHLTYIFITFPLIFELIRNLFCCLDYKLLKLIKKYTTNSALVHLIFTTNVLLPPIRQFWSLTSYIIDGVRFNYAKKQGNEEKMVRLYEDMRDALEVHSSLSENEALLETTPQLLLQTYVIMYCENQASGARICSMAISVLSLACTLPGMQLPALLNEADDATGTQQEETTWLSGMVRTFGHMCGIASQSIGLSLSFYHGFPAPMLCRFLITFFLVKWNESTNFGKKVKQFTRIFYVLEISLLVFVHNQNYFSYATNWTVCFVEKTIAIAFLICIKSDVRFAAETEKWKICLLDIGLLVASGLLLTLYFKLRKWVGRK